VICLCAIATPCSYVPDRYHYEEWLREFNGYVANLNLPDLEIMSVPLDHFGSFSGNVGGLNTLELKIADNDYALGKMVEAARTRNTGSTPPSL
jgi:hypothetical protein